MRIDNSDKKVIRYYDLYFDPNDPGMTDPVDLCKGCAAKWPEEIYIDAPPETFICYDCGEVFAETKTRNIGRGGPRPGSGPKPKPANTKYQMLTVTIPPELMDQLRAIQADQEITLSGLVTKLLTAALGSQ